MQVVWRFEISSAMCDESGELTLMMPKDAKLLFVDEHGVQPSLWAMVDPKAEKVERKLLAVKTGKEFPWYVGQGSYVGTFMDREMYASFAVFHVFDRGEVQPSRE